MPRAGKIVLHLLIGIQLGKKDNILGSIPNQLGSIWFHPNSMPSQTPTNHPYGFFRNINNSVPKRNWNFGSLKINYVYLCINRRNSFSESTVWDFFRKWVWLKIFWPVAFYRRQRQYSIVFYCILLYWSVFCVFYGII